MLEPDGVTVHQEHELQELLSVGQGEEGKRGFSVPGSLFIIVE